MASSFDILDHMTTGVIALDDKLSVQEINSAAEALLEVSAARTEGLHISQLLAEPTIELVAHLRETLNGNSPRVRRSLPLTLHAGQEIHVDVIVTPVLQDQSPAGLLVELQAVDRLQRISREEALLNAQEATRAVVRGLAHEIKNPLGGVRGAAQLLARELPDEELAEYTRIIIREADRLRDLVDRMQGPSDRPSVENLNIHEILEHVRNLVEAESGDQITINRDYDPSLPELTADRSQLIQAVLNIVRNAMQVAVSQEECEIILRTRSQRQFTIGNQRHRLVCRVDILDNGPGIPEHMLHAIFVPMVTGRAEGTGLGLSIAQSIINRHGGLLECDSEPGNTRFTIYLPLETEYAEAS